MYNHFYRIPSENFQNYTVKVKETNLFIKSHINKRNEIERNLKDLRKDIEDYIQKRKNFLNSLKPLKIDEDAPQIVKEMMKYTQIAGVGPMAAVAGAIAEFVGKGVMNDEEYIIENGGDIFLKLNTPPKIAIFAGSSPLSGMMIKLKKDPLPYGICTSSATVGPSLSLGKTDACVIISHSAILSDALATRIGNIVKDEKDIKTGLNFAQNINAVLGCIIIIGNKTGMWGDIEVCKG
ncbi:MAG: UPF0280 family protein [Deltaproteobacteria bacterium]|nr:UPF0280 family protein [Deltaproteobacteria bacterium]